MKTHARAWIVLTAMFAAAGTIAIAQKSGDGGGQAADMNKNAAQIRFAGVAVRPTPPTQPIEITLARWSTPDERTRLTTAFARAKTPEAYGEALTGLPALGAVRTLNDQGDTVRYAERRGDRVILVTDPLEYFRPEATPNESQPGYSIVEFYVGGANKGKGWVSYGENDAKTTPRTGDMLSIPNATSKQPQLMDIKQLDDTPGAKGMSSGRPDHGTPTHEDTPATSEPKSR
jgi:hypothetical protein